MPVSCVEEGRTLTVRIGGEVDHHAARQLMEELARRVEAALPKHLEMDLGDVSFMDSSGIAVVLRLWRRMQELEGTMTVTRVPPQAAKVLKAAGIDRLVAFEE